MFRAIVKALYIYSYNGLFSPFPRPITVWKLILNLSWCLSNGPQEELSYWVNGTYYDCTAGYLKIRNDSLKLIVCYGLHTSFDN